MYSYAKKFYSKREEFERSLIENFEKTFNMNHTNYSTEVIINRLKSEVFKKIFKIIDRDGKKMISIFNMDIKKLPFNISDILEPILTKIKTENCRIDEESFIDNCNQLFEVLSQEKKNIFLNFNKPIFKRNRSSGDKFSFKPTINKKHTNKRNIISLDKKWFNNSTSSSSINHLRKQKNYSSNNIALSNLTIKKDNFND